MRATACLGTLLGLSLIVMPLGGLDGIETASAAPKVVDACGAKALPLSVGNSWTFTPVAPPEEATPQQKLFLPVQPKKVVLTVADVKTDDAKVTTVSITEDIDGRVINSTITCSATKFTISPNSFLYVGEPGAWMGLEFSDWTPSGPTWQLSKGKFTPEWREDVKATWRRTDADKATGKLELEHQFAVGAPEVIGTEAGTFSAFRLIVEITGRVTLDKTIAAEKPFELPANWINALWFAEGVGPVQVLNAYAHMYSLQSFKLAS